jgi:hypothetical protein
MGPKQPPSSEHPVAASGTTPAPAPAPAPAPGPIPAPGPAAEGRPQGGPQTGREDTVTVEAATAEKALEEVTGLLGPDAEILRADKVQRGGIGGFFAKEVVQLTARRRSGSSQGPSGPSGPSGIGGIGGPSSIGGPAIAPTDQAAPAAPVVFAGPAAQPAAALRAPGANGAQDPFAEALSRFLSDQTDKDAPAAHLLGGRPPPAGQPGHAVRPPLPSSHDEARPSAPAASDALRPFIAAVGDAIRPFTPAVIEASAAPAPAAPPSLPAPPAIPAAPAAQARSEAPVQQAPGAAAAPAAVVLDVPAAAGPVTSPAPGRPPAAPAGPAGTGSPDWSPEGLLRLGLPVSLVRPMIENPPSTDAQWIDALARSVARLCGPVAGESQLLVGPRAHLLAGPLQLPQADYPDTPPASGSAVMALHVPTADLGLVLRLLGDRRLHLVAGGEGWERLASLRPSLVSWVGAEALPAALAFCAGQGLTLGYGRAGTGGPVFHATPLDVALALRDLVGRR